jgi:glycosyltransferase involved in cell wall biosynthesis
MSMLGALRSIGYEVTLLSSAQFTDNLWTRESIDHLQDNLGFAVEIHEPTDLDLRYTALAGQGQGSTVNFSMFTPPGLRQCFRNAFQRLSPDLILVNYSLWGGLAIGDEFSSALRLIDTIDLYSRNLKMSYVLHQYLPRIPIRLKEVDPLLMEEDFFSRFDVEATPDEYWIFSQYDYTIAISPSEARAIRQYSQNTRVEYLPITLDPQFVQNTYTGSPLFAIGPNPFNLQGYCYFAKKVLPIITKKLPEFNLNVVGSSCEKVVPVSGSELLGFVPDLAPLYTESRFAICPLIGGTGQQVKITEAMAYGVPVIALSNLAESSPIESGINGFIAQNAEEFAEQALMLSKDQALCRRLGEAARDTIARQFSEQRLIEQLDVILRNSESLSIQQTSKPFPTIVVDGIFFQISQTTGIARVWRSLLEEWLKTGFSEHIVILNRAQTAPQLQGIRYRSVHGYREDEPGLDAEVLQAICDEESADLFISTYYTTPISTPSIFMGYDMIPEMLNMDLSAPIWREKRLGILHATHYITISENTGNDLKKIFPYISSGQITVAYCGINPRFFPANPKEIEQFKMSHKIKKPYFLFVGVRMGYGGYKNSSLLFRALNQLDDNQNVSVVCVGGQPELEKELQELTKDITSYLVRLTDDELRIAYSGALALVYPSRYEGFGLPIAEAMACGCPVITCCNSSIPEVAGEAALYVDPSDSMELAVALEKVQEPRIRQSLRDRGLAQAQKFSWTKMAKTVADTLVQVAQDEHDHDRDMTRHAQIWLELRKLQQQKQPDAHPQFQVLQNHIAAMESSKFWKLRELWFRCKRLLKFYKRN